jgi:hypothetical protein
LIFHAFTVMPQVLSADPSTLLCHVTPLLLCDNDEAMVEAARAYGNFSRAPAARVYMQEVRAVHIKFMSVEASPEAGNA